MKNSFVVCSGVDYDSAQALASALPNSLGAWCESTAWRGYAVLIELDAGLDKGEEFRDMRDLVIELAELLAGKL